MREVWDGDGGGFIQISYFTVTWFGFTKHLNDNYCMTNISHLGQDHISYILLNHDNFLPLVHL